MVVRIRTVYFSKRITLAFGKRYKVTERLSFIVHRMTALVTCEVYGSLRPFVLSRIDPIHDARNLLYYLFATKRDFDIIDG